MVNNMNIQKWHEKLFKKSILKQQKLNAIVEMISLPANGLYLDLGGDNGVISLWLRKKIGRQWLSADIDPLAVRSMKELLGDEAFLISQNRIPLEDRSLGLVIIIDLLEHLEDDRGFVKELARVIKPGGELIVNVPYYRYHSILKKLKEKAGDTDETHGHIRPGYKLFQLKRLLLPWFEIEKSMTYSKFFSQLIDVGIGFAYRHFKGDSEKAGSKGVLFTSSDYSRLKKQFRFYSILYPLFFTMSILDRLLVGIEGYNLILRARRLEEIN